MKLPMKAMTRRRFLAASATVAGAAATRWTPLQALAQTPARAGRPNVLFITCDDLRPQLGCYGATDIKTPNIDRLASGGVLFERAYAQVAICTPSRTSFLSGARPDTLGIYDNSKPKNLFRAAAPQVVTLPEQFRKSGYFSRAEGKVFHIFKEQGADAASWDVQQWMAPDSSEYALPENQAILAKIAEKGAQSGKKRPLTEAADVPDDAYSDGLIAQRVIAALREMKGKGPGQPFFLAVGFEKPHRPLAAPKKYWDLYRREEIELPDNPHLPRNAPLIAVKEADADSGRWATPQSRERLREQIHAYRACISYVDAQIGRVLDELERLGLAENTIVVLMGDHGFALGENGQTDKDTNFEMSLRAPLIVRAPGVAVNQKARGLVEFVDIYPSLCDLAGLPKPAHLEGQSFAPRLRAPRAAGKEFALSQCWRAKKGIMGYSLRTDRYRYNEWIKRDTGRVVATELYDHQADPGENANVAGGADKTLLASLSRQLRTGFPAIKKPPAAAPETAPAPAESGRKSGKSKAEQAGN